ncbi:MAG: DUF2256 domain-containing protein [Candidatus Promineifilaceae bacterium]
MSKMRLKRDLPTKVCRTCGKAFSWRRIWARDWDSVQFCSQGCRGESKRGDRWQSR